MNDKPKKKRPYMELYSEQSMPEGAWQDLLDFVAGINGTNVTAFYILVCKRPIKGQPVPGEEGK